MSDESEIPVTKSIEIIEMDLPALITELKFRREVAAEAKSKVSTLEYAFEASDEYVNAISIKQSAQLALDECDARVRKYAADHFDGVNKHPHPNVDIDMKNFVTIEYDKQKAHEWALTHNTGVLDLNDAEFKKLIIAEKVPADIIKVFEKKIVPTPTISKKLWMENK